MKRPKKKAAPRRTRAQSTPESEHAGRDTEPCPVVGFGASAGGLDAFTEFLEHLRPGPGYAIVFVQHLDPKSVSILSELLTRATPLRVRQVTDGMTLEANHIYVIPPNADMIVQNNHLHLKPRPQGQHMPIDTFFRSLARDRAEKAIGIVLSGTATDGTLGLKAIKAEGGITFAQEPASAKFDGMPRSAIASGSVDFVLSPERIALELSRLHRHPYLAAERPETVPPSDQEQRSFNEVLNLLRSLTGVDFTLYKLGTIRRRMMRRMAFCEKESFREYLQYVRQERSELTQLFQDILINVTAFFRESITFDALKERILPLILKDKSPEESLRVWVPGCATGEEAYSTAICLLEYMRESGNEMPIHVFGTDLSDSALERARAGVYPETIAADVSPERLGHFFVRVNSSYQITQSLRDKCIFARQNIAKDAPFSRLDLILCRNVLIYLGPSLQVNAMRLFHYALRPQGYLVLGLSESTGPASELFAAVDNKLKIYSKKPGPFALSMDMGAYQEPRQIRSSRERSEIPSDLNSRRRVDQILLARYSPAAVVVDKGLRILEFRGRTAPYLEHSPGAANLNLVTLAPRALGLEIQKLVRRAETKSSLIRGKVMSMSLKDVVLKLQVLVSPLQLQAGVEPQFLVIIEEVRTEKPRRQPTEKTSRTTRPSALRQRVKDLDHELMATRENLRSVIEDQEAAAEELKSANEEIQSGNEELQSTNEELLTAKEELQSTNEELTTVNEEMHSRNAELQQVNNDLLNLLSSVNIPMLMLGNDLRIRRFTPQAEKLFNLLFTDVGRPVSDLHLKINVPDLISICHDVLDELTAREREVQDSDGRSYSMWVRPYRTSENRIDGVVISLFDVTERKQLAEARYQHLSEATADGIVIADATTGEIVDVNPFVIRRFAFPRKTLVGTKVWESPLFKGSDVDQALLERLRGADSLQIDLSLRTAAGEPVPAQMIGNTYVEADRKIVCFCIREHNSRARA